jgi:predicted ferric reductase
MKTIDTTKAATPQERIATPPPAPPAKRPPEQPGNLMLTVAPPLVGALAGIVILVVIGLGLAGQAGGWAALATALVGQHSAWYLSRASAFVAYVLLWWSMILGLSITNRLARLWPGGPAAADLHEHASLLGLGFGVLHALVLLGDSYIGYTLPQILLPFGGSYQTVWVGLGQIGLYLMALVTFTFYIRRWIGARAWRTIHFLSFLVFALSVLHGVFSGSDSSLPWVFWMYVATSASVLAMTIYRVVGLRGASSAPARLAGTRAAG